MDKTSIKDSASLPRSLCGWNKHNSVSSAVCWREVPALPFYPLWAAKSNLHNQDLSYLAITVSYENVTERLPAISCRLTIQIWSWLYLTEPILKHHFCPACGDSRHVSLSLQQLSFLLLLCPAMCVCARVWWKQLCFHVWVYSFYVKDF